MNIDAITNVVLQGQLVTLESQVVILTQHAEQTGEDVTKILTEINNQITKIKGMMT